MALNPKQMQNVRPSKADLLLDEEDGLSTHSNFSKDLLNNLKEEINDTNSVKGHSVTPSSETNKLFKDIDINLIDESKLNEKMFGYNHEETLKESIETDDDTVSIVVYDCGNGRYRCRSGNTRLRVFKKLGKKKITCQICGSAPVSDLTEAEDLARSNIYRHTDPYHNAMEIKIFEDLYREEKGLSGDMLIAAVADITGFKETSQKYYKQILKLDPTLQLLFNSETVPFKPMLAACKKVPADKVREFASLYRQLKEIHEESSELIERVFVSVVKNTVADNAEPKPVRVKFSKTYKDIVNLTCDENGTYFIPDSKKDDYKKQVELMIEELGKIKAACEA